ncbi:MAG: type VI secretion system ATPase TssH [Parashewanella sp.]
MINIELQNLVRRLSPALKESLEGAAGECLARTHYSIELEHWFYKLLQQTAMGWHNAAQYTGVETTTLLDRLNESINAFSKGNKETPALSSSLVELLKDAWMIASLNESQNKINEYHLLEVLKQRVVQGAYNGALSYWIESLSSEWLMASSKSLGVSSIETSHENPTGYKNSGEEAATPSLDKYSKNLTAAAKLGELDPISGRSVEIRKSIDILCRRRQNSPILVGEPGVGKTAIAEGLAQQIVEGNVPPSLKNIELRSLDLSLLQAGASIKGEFENRLKDIINEIKAASTPIIMFIDEAHTLIGAGGTAGQNDAANILKPALARGEFRSIAATTWAEYKQYFETDAALTRRFQLVSINEPSEADAIQMLSGVAASLERHHKVKIMQEAIAASVSLSIRYLPERMLPDKAISLLDTACSRIGLSQNACPQAIEQLNQQIDYTKSEIDAITHEHALWSLDDGHLQDAQQRLTKLTEQADGLMAQWQQEKQLVEHIIQLQSTLDGRIIAGDDVEDSNERSQLKALMDELTKIQGESPLVIPQVTQQTVAEVISLWTGIPVGNMLKQEVDRLLNLESFIGERVIGQVAPISEISKAIRMSRAGLTDPRKPVGVFLMCGPSGVGKTETALALTDELYGGEDNITTINMTEFKEEHKISMLLGSPAGYVGYGKGGVLTEAVRKNPYSVLLLDEMEKAHPGVHDIFYQIFDKGSISDSEGRSIDFRNTIIIMTSNAADSEVVQACEVNRPSVTDLTQQILPALQRSFKPAFIGRTTVVPYFPLNDEEMAQIAQLSFKRIEKRVRKHYDACFSYDSDVIDKLVKLNHSPETGARAIEQIINRQLMPLMANKCIERLSLALPITEVNIYTTDNTFNIDVH